MTPAPINRPPSDVSACFVLNNRLSPPPEAGEPSNAASAAMPVLDSSLDSSDSYTGDDAQCFLQEWRVAKDRYSEATQENGQLEIRLEASQAARAQLAESNAMVKGKMDSKKTSVLIFSTFVLIVYFFL